MPSSVSSESACPKTPANVTPDTPAWVASIASGLASLANAACVISADEIVFYANPVFFLKTGKSASAVIGRPLAEVNGNEYSQIAQASILRATKTKSAASFGQAWRTLENNTIWVDFHYLPHLDEHNEVLGFTAVAVEKYALSVDDAAVIERERLLRQLSNSTGDPILYIDQSLTVRFANKPLLDWIDKKEHKVIGFAASEVFNADAFNFYLPLVTRAFAGEKVEIETPSKSRANGVRRIVITIAPDCRANGDIGGVFMTTHDIEDDFQLRREITERERQLQLFTNNIPQAVSYLDTERRYKFVNNTFVSHRSKTREEVIGKTVLDVFGVEVDALFAPYGERAYLGETVAYERQVLLHSGEKRWYQVRIVPDFLVNATDANPDAGNLPKVQGIYVVGVDIEDAKQTEAALMRERAELRQANWQLTSHFENTPLAVVEWDGDLRICRWSKQAEKIFGWTEADVIGKRFDDAQFIYDEDSARIDEIGDRIRGATRPSSSYLHRTHRKDGTEIWVEWYNSSLTQPDGSVISSMSLAQDVTLRVLAESRLQHQATHDVLTGLPNRSMLQTRMHEAISRARRSGDRVAALFIDLDRFKDVNDTLGHRIGDELLCEMARRLAAAIRESDFLVRLSGDEFMVILEQISDANAHTLVATKLLAEMRRATIIEGNEIFVAGSIGISIFPDDATDAEALLKNADMAMYRAKEIGKNTFQLFSRSMAEQSNNMRMLENALRGAITRNELVLHYQPKVDMLTNTIVGAEALLRWQHPTRGLIMPNDFIHLAEETGLIHEIGLWVLDEALAQMGRWQAAGLPAIKIAINIAAGQFRASHLADKFNQHLQQTAIDPSLLEIEVTETGLIRDPEGVGHTLNQLRALGITVAIDDFGTGYSSLSHLKRFPIDTIKIDQSFVADLLIDADDRAIVSAVIALAHALEINVVAEGVETAAQRDMLHRMGCNIYQGYLFARPCPAADFQALLIAGKSV